MKFSTAIGWAFVSTAASLMIAASLHFGNKGTSLVIPGLATLASAQPGQAPGLRLTLDSSTPPVFVGIVLALGCVIWAVSRLAVRFTRK